MERATGRCGDVSTQRNIVEGESNYQARKQGRAIKRYIHGENISLDHVFVVFYVVQDVNTFAGATCAAIRAE
jgi:hypothetical protein